MGAGQEHVRQSCQRNNNQDMGPQSEDLFGEPHTLKPSLYVPISTRPN
jgi:hypothetical protein